MDAPSELGIGELTLRPVHLCDEAAYLDAVIASHDHLAEFEGWAQAVPTAASTRSWFEWCARGWDQGERLVYGALDRAGDFVACGGLYRSPSEESLYTIGYWTRADRIMKGYATLLAVALTQVALGGDGPDALEIHCDVANSVSARIPRRLGYQLVAHRPRAVTAPKEQGVAMIWRLERRWYQRTYAHRLWVEERRIA
jgi:RimJ/RimL family protein N-acetyltransferase